MPNRDPHLPPVRYRITQGDQSWIVKLSAPDEDGSKLARWIIENKIVGAIAVRCEWREDRKWRTVGPMTVNDVSDDDA